MLKECLVEVGHLLACRAVNKHAVEDVHADDLFPQPVAVAWCRLGELLHVVVEVDAFAVENGVFAGSYAHHVELESAAALEHLTL